MQRAISVLLAVALVAGAAGAVTATGGIDGQSSLQSTAECEFPVTATDATDTEVTIEEEPDSVVTLNPSAAQMLWEIGAEEKVTGVTKHAMNLDGSEERTNISREGETISHEIVVDLEPDLVLVPLSRVATTEDVETLREAGLTVYAYPTADSIDEIRERTLQTGEFVGECDGAAETVDWMDEESALVEDAVEDEEPVDVLYTFFGFTAGEGTHIHEILETAGGTNIAAEVGIEEYEPISEEVVLDEDPEWIVLNTNSPEIPEGEGFEQTTAVQENQTVTVDVNMLNRPGPRVVHVITELAETFHPEAYATAVAQAEETPTPTPTEATPTPTPDETESSADETATPTPDDTPTPESSDTSDTADGADDDGIGFGVVAVLAALVGVSVAALVTNIRKPREQ